MGIEVKVKGTFNTQQFFEKLARILSQRENMNITVKVTWQQEEKKKKNELTEEIDKTIKKVCENINNSNGGYNRGITTGYADTVKALALLVEARAKLNWTDRNS